MYIKSNRDVETLTTLAVGIITHAVQKGMDMWGAVTCPINCRAITWIPIHFLCETFRNCLRLASVEKAHSFRESCHHTRSVSWTKPLVGPGTHEVSPAISLSLSLQELFYVFLTPLYPSNKLSSHLPQQITLPPCSQRKTENLREELPWLFPTDLPAPT